jgi:integrase
MGARKGWGSVRHRTDKKSRRFPDGGWEARWYSPDGRQHSQTFPTKLAAERHLRIKLGEKEKGEYIDHRLNRTLFEEVAEAWFQNLPAKTKPKTRAGYATILRTLEESPLWHRQVGRVKAGDIEDFLNGLKVAPGTQRNILRVISMIMNRAVKHEMIPTNPCRLTAKISVKRPERIFLSPGQVAELAAEVDDPVLVYFAAYTGLRAGEIGGLRVRNLDPLHGRIEVKEAVSDVAGHLFIGTPKNGEAQEVGFPRFLADRLNGHLAGKGPDDFLFGSGPMRHGNWYGRHFKPAVKRLVGSGTWPEELLSLRFHDLRHTCASILIELGIHPKKVSEWLGHKSINITMDLYGHLYKESADEISARLNERFEEAAATATPGTRTAS